MINAINPPKIFVPIPIVDVFMPLIPPAGSILPPDDFDF
jgi:hypothetical protein